MTLKLKNNDGSALIPGKKGGRPFIGMLLLSIGLVLSFLQQAIANPVPRNFASFTVTPAKDHSVANSGIPDVITVTVNPSSPDVNLTYEVIVGGVFTGVSSGVTSVGGVATINIYGSNPGTVTVNIYKDGALVGSIDMHFIAAPGPPDLTNSYISYVVQTNPADGTSQDIVQAGLYDQWGNPCSTAPQVQFAYATIPVGHPVLLVTNSALPYAT